jgi:hypothetical protein
VGFTLFFPAYYKKLAGYKVTVKVVIILIKLPLIASLGDSTDTTGDLGTPNTIPRAILGTSTQSTLGKCLPNLTLVLTTSQSSISIKDSITGLDKVGVAWLPVS